MRRLPKEFAEYSEIVPDHRYPKGMGASAVRGGPGFAAAAPVAHRFNSRPFSRTLPGNLAPTSHRVRWPRLACPTS